jgi:hypothetical protein
VSKVRAASKDRITVTTPSRKRWGAAYSPWVEADEPLKAVPGAAKKLAESLKQKPPIKR